MKRILNTFLFSFFVFALQAQNPAGYFAFSNQNEFDALYKALNVKVKFSPEEQEKIFKLLQQSFNFQTSILNSERAKTDKTYVANSLQRQTLHIEGNMKNILSPEKFAEFEKAKVDIKLLAAEYLKKMGNK